MRVLIFGATGMVGAGVLLECLDDARVRSVVTVGRSATGRTHPKLREIAHRDFTDFRVLREEFAAVDACFFGLGVSSAGMSEADYTRITFDTTMAAAQVLADANPQATFVYVSGEGTDSTERGRVMWARVKGRTENAILALPFRGYIFRPGFILPERGVRSKTPWVQAGLLLTRPLHGLVMRLLPKWTTTSTAVGRAFLRLAATGGEPRILASVDITRVGAP